MPSFDIVRTSQPTDSFRVQSIIGTYDLQQQHVTERFTGNIELPEKWNIGLIVGRSGSGKSTIAHELFDADIINGFDWSHDNIPFCRGAHGEVERVFFMQTSNRVF